MGNLADVTLDDKYAFSTGRVFISGIQALVRLLMQQHAADRAAGLNTAGFVSGYRGSPLGMLDNELWRNRQRLTQHDIVFQPGLNEDLAATAVWGSQQANLRPGATVDGVFGMWYGKAPGLDRSMDVLKHANMTGTSPLGGVLAVVGDDHGCQSSTLASQSEQLFEAAMMPVLNPANVQEYLEFGLYGFALSRFSGCWVGFKAIAETVETAASVDLGRALPEIVLPTDLEMPSGGLGIRWPDPPLEMERRLHGPKMEAVAAFARANYLDRIVIDSPQPRLGIITTGKAYLDVRQALDDLGLDADALIQLGVRLYKVGLTWPLESSGALRFAQGLQDVLVVEEKRAFIETQLLKLLYNLPAHLRPSVVGKQDEEGRRLINSEGDLSPSQVAHAIVQRLARLGTPVDEYQPRLARMQATESIAPASSLMRAPMYCSGCPHNTSTVVPHGSHAMAGIGCHGMAIFMPERKTTTHTQMGGEGANWIGQAPFRNDEHIFQNLGDGTYNHSGSIALRAAAAAGISITYKILVNDAVAMTGGQPIEGHPTVSQIAQQVHAEGAKRVAVVSDHPQQYSTTSFPSGTTVHHRDELDSVQRKLRDIKGLTVLIYEQTCAAEKRRRRKRGQMPDPAVRAFINEAVCEGCGDCSVQSNCISVRPVETAFGRKREIDQSACNRDLSCLKGFCPSFVTVRGGRIRSRIKEKTALPANMLGNIPMPVTPPLSGPYGILVTGIGGTGVLTIGALLGMAAHLEQKGVSVLDFTGLSQKNGSVVSHVRIAPEPADLQAVRIGAGASDLLLACDEVASAGVTVMSRIGAGHTKAIVNTHEQPTFAFINNPDLNMDSTRIQSALRDAVGSANIDFVNANRIATRVLGDSIASNLFMLGYAFQKGLIPLSLDALERAIELNGVAVDLNKNALALGRLAAHQPDAIHELLGSQKQMGNLPETTSDEVIESRARLLTQYQNTAYAKRYRTLIERVRSRTASVKNAEDFARAVAENFYKVMAYKDEYEVARLYTDGQFERALKQQFEGDFRLQFHLAPPLLSRVNPSTGRPRKMTFGPWMLPVFRVLAAMRSLRGTFWDPFGRTEERKMERLLVNDYEQTIGELCTKLDENTLPVATEIARLPEKIRGFGPVKRASVEQAARRRDELLTALRQSKSTMTAAA